ncbi:MAG: tetratricopeptide repeat protein [Gemmatimonadota bacterium]
MEIGRLGRRLGLWLALLVAAVWVGPAAAQDLTPAQRHFEQGYAYQMGDGVKQDLEMALRHYREAIKLDPAMFEANVNAAQLYFRRGELQYAMQYFSQAITIARSREDISTEEEARACSDLGVCYFQKGSMKEAEQWFRFAIRRDPSLAEAHYNLINLLVKENRVAEARQAMEVASRQAPSTRYGFFEGRLRSKESHEEWFPAWMQIAAAIFLGSLVAYALYHRLTRQ